LDQERLDCMADGFGFGNSGRRRLRLSAVSARNDNAARTQSQRPETTPREKGFGGAAKHRRIHRFL
jgi:hypothetical protein